MSQVQVLSLRPEIKVALVGRNNKNKQKGLFFFCCFVWVGLYIVFLQEVEIT